VRGATNLLPKEISFISAEEMNAVLLVFDVWALTLFFLGKAVLFVPMIGYVLFEIEG
jgi:type IV secretory pathway TrbL component